MNEQKIKEWRDANVSPLTDAQLTPGVCPCGCKGTLQPAGVDGAGVFFYVRCVQCGRLCFVSRMSGQVTWYARER